MPPEPPSGAPVTPEDLQAVLGEIVGPVAVPAQIATMAQAGWTATDAHRLMGLVEYAVTHRTPIAVWAAEDRTSITGVNPTRIPGVVFETLRSDLEILEESGASRDTAFAWATLFATATTDRAALTVTHHLFDDHTPSEERYLQAWLALGPIGALAWAAGLTLTEATEHHTADGIDVDSLRGMAALRGWRLSSES